MSPNGLVTLLTDFGARDTYVGVMKGVILGIAPAARLVDLTHEVPPQAITVGALLLRNAVTYFPAGTVHLAVVDPGVGSMRDPVAVLTEHGVLIGPDNGLLSPSAEAMGLRGVWRLDREELFRLPISPTFHGRDIFAPVAAHLAAGLPIERVGGRLPELHPLLLPEPRVEHGTVHGEVLYVDHFGNLITNVPAAALKSFPAQSVSVTIGGMVIRPLSSTYASVSHGSPVLVVGSWGLLEIAIRDGRAADVLDVVAGTRATVHMV